MRNATGRYRLFREAKGDYIALPRPSFFAFTGPPGPSPLAISVKGCAARVNAIKCDDSWRVTKQEVIRAANWWAIVSIGVKSPDSTHNPRICRSLGESSGHSDAAPLSDFFIRGQEIHRVVTYFVTAPIMLFLGSCAVHESGSGIQESGRSLSLSL